MRVLFSPIGISDPISNYHDGAMLHICRFYDIDKVYLYLSREVIEYHNSDNRYIYCLNKLAELKGKQIDYEIISREELDDVHLFDYFFNEYKEILDNIHNEYLNAELFVNVSSGTPAMKSSLQTLAALSDYKVTPIQVATPVKSSNPHKDDKVDYCPETQWELNEDNIENYEVRCSESSQDVLRLLLRKKVIKKLIEEYDYDAAYLIAKDNKEQFSEDFLRMIEASMLRKKLNYGKARIAFKEITDCEIVPIVESDRIQISEYLLLLDLMVKRHEYSSFLRAISPFLVGVGKMILRKRYSFNVDEYTKIEDDCPKWDLTKMNEEVLNHLNSAYSGKFEESYIKFDNLCKIIGHYDCQSDIYKKCKKAKAIEKDLRNYLSHELADIDDAKVSKIAHMSSKDIIKLFKDLAINAGFRITEDYFNSYDKMNQILFKYL